MAFDRLLTQLNNTQLATKDNPLYQVLKQLINDLIKLNNAINAINSGDITNTTIINEQIFQIVQGDEGNDGDIGPPGIRGIDGAIGPTGPEGPPFPALIYLESDLPEDVLPIPGPQGPQGVAGATGAQGEQSIGFVLHEDCDADPDIIMIGSSGGGSSPWELIEARVCSASANEDFINLSNYSEIIVFCKNITKAVSGILQFRVSTDNGSTFLTAATDYISIAATGIITGQTEIDIHNTNATAVRSGIIYIRAFNLTGLKPVQSTATIPNWAGNNTTAYNAIRVYNSGGGNLTAGTIYVYGRR